MNRRTIEERFWAKVIIGDGCWEWTASTTNRGYGLIGIHENGRNLNKLAHHVSLYLKSGTWLKYVMHHCDNPKCVRPDHLKESTPAENLRDASVKGRLAGTHVKQICKRGHPLSGENLYRHREVNHCRACNRLRDRAHKDKVARVQRRENN